MIDGDLQQFGITRRSQGIDAFFEFEDVVGGRVILASFRFTT